VAALFSGIFCYFYITKVHKNYNNSATPEPRERKQADFFYLGETIGIFFPLNQSI
jgi:hypothetical protein